MEFFNHCQQGEPFGWQEPYLQIGQPQLHLAVFFVSKHHRTASVCDLRRRNRDRSMPCGRNVGLHRPLIGPPLFRSWRGKMIWSQYFYGGTLVHIPEWPSGMRSLERLRLWPRLTGRVLYFRNSPSRLLLCGPKNRERYVQKYDD